VTDDALDDLRSLLDAPSPAVLTTYRVDGRAFTTPVWFRRHQGSFEVVIADGDVKLGNLARDPRCSLVVFETVPPFRGVRVDGEAVMRRDHGGEVRAAIAERFLGPVDGARFVAARTSTPGVVLSLPVGDARAWDLSGILPA
jgi:PPOX class probable F420-dependent enzyme